ncbi:MAG TPA: TIR domain-containing protein [Kofleriaceae bacterium]
MTARAPGRIVTFYSYKGGTGRSMAVANIAWILASNGKRVLVIDWDLEAPGLHRYLHPFLDDKELECSPGLIDYFVDVEVAARNAAATDGAPWWQDWTSLIRYTTSLEWDFPDEGGIDFVPAGQQGPAYAERVRSVDWRRFYDVLGGGVLLEALKQQLREDYDYVLIDSRTGISDTAGICTVQMPDDLVVCFTLNQQSIKGAAAAAESAWVHRLKPSGEPGLRVWPLPTRIELAEKERLDAARESARATFDRFVRHLTRVDRAGYWARVEVLYQPFFAYEEILAPFAERRQQTGSMLGSMEALTAAFTDGGVTRLAEMSEKLRRETYVRFVPPRARPATARGSGTVYLSYSRWLISQAKRIVTDLKASGLDVFWDVDRVQLGDDIAKVLNAGLEAAAVVVVVVGNDDLGPSQGDEVARALKLNKRIIPVVVTTVGLERLPSYLSRFQGVDLRPGEYERNCPLLIAGLQKIVGQAELPPANPDDPEKGRWGGSATTSSRRMTAEVQETSPDWYRVTVTVEGLGDDRLEGEVEFHLHPSFTPAVIRRIAEANRATLPLGAWGAFTIGAVCDGGATMLELDLAEVESFPEKFRAR